MRLLSAAVLTALLVWCSSAVYAQLSQGDCLANADRTLCGSTDALHRAISTPLPATNVDESSTGRITTGSVEPARNTTNETPVSVSNTNCEYALDTAVEAFVEAAKVGKVEAKAAPKKAPSKALYSFSSPPPAVGIGRKITVTAYAYCLNGRTATGSYTDYGTIAVDPGVIPLGAKVYIPGYGWGSASDTGGAVCGNAIDIWLPTNSDCMQWGVRTLTVTVLP